MKLRIWIIKGMMILPQAHLHPALPKCAGDIGAKFNNNTQEYFVVAHILYVP